MKKTKTKPQLRIEIARDVIKQIEARNIIAECGEYFYPCTKNNAQYAGKQLQEVLPKLASCRACALGGIFYSYVTKYNNFQIDEYGINNTSFMHEDMRELITIFPTSQLELIECAFESKDVFSNCTIRNHYSKTTIKRAENYREKHGIEFKLKKDNALLVFIMKNIIANKGIFKP